MEQEQITPEVEQEPQEKVPKVQQVEIVKKPLLPKYLFTIFILLILGAATWFVYQYVAQDIDVTESEDARIVDSHEEMEQTEVLPNVFNSTIAEGEQYGSMTAREIDVSNEDRIKVTFVGETTLVGQLSMPTGDPNIDGGMAPDYSVSNFTESSLEKIPHANTDNRQVWFGIENPDIVDVSGLSNRDKVEVVIDKYNYTHYPAGVWNTARIVSIKKTEDEESSTGIAIEYGDQTNKYIDTKEGFSFEYPNTWTYEVEEKEHETSKIVYKKTKFFSTGGEDMMLVGTPVREIGYESTEVKYQTNMLIADSDVEMSITTYKEEYLNPSSQMISWFSEEWNSSVEMILHEPLVGPEEGRGAAQIRESVRILEKDNKTSLKLNHVTGNQYKYPLENLVFELPGGWEEESIEKLNLPDGMFNPTLFSLKNESCRMAIAEIKIDDWHDLYQQSSFGSRAEDIHGNPIQGDWYVPNSNKSENFSFNKNERNYIEGEVLFGGYPFPKPETEYWGDTFIVLYHSENGVVSDSCEEDYNRLRETLEKYYDPMPTKDIFDGYLYFGEETESTGETTIRLLFRESEKGELGSVKTFDETYGYPRELYVYENIVYGVFEDELISYNIFTDTLERITEGSIFWGNLVFKNGIIYRMVYGDSFLWELHGYNIETKENTILADNISFSGRMSDMGPSLSFDADLQRIYVNTAWGDAGCSSRSTNWFDLKTNTFVNGEVKGGCISETDSSDDVVSFDSKDTQTPIQTNFLEVRGGEIVTPTEDTFHEGGPYVDIFHTVD